mgnify:CR=1 FL=1
MFSELIGQETARKMLAADVERSRLAQFYLFIGPQGVGKALAGRLSEGATLEEELAQLQARRQEATAREREAREARAAAQAGLVGDGGVGDLGKLPGRRGLRGITDE